MQAPSAGNQQPWEFIVVSDRGTLAALAKTSPYAGPAAGSAVTLVLLCNLKGLRFPECWQQDMSAAAENILLEAAGLGLGGVWMGVAGADDRAAYLKKLFDLPDHVLPFALIALGYPAEERAASDRYRAERVHYGKYRGAPD